MTLAAANPPQHHGNAQTTKAKAAETVQDAPFRAYPNPYSDRCYRSQNHDAAELCAEWRSAVSGEKAAHEARRATNWAIIASLFGVASFAGLIFTIIQTHRALSEARKSNRLAMKANARASRQSIATGADTQVALSTARQSAEAAIRQVEVTEANQRPWIDFKAFCGPSRDHIPTIDNITFSVSVNIINKGNFPAEEVSIVAEGFIAPDIGKSVIFSPHGHKSWVYEHFDRLLDRAGTGTRLFFGENDQAEFDIIISPDGVNVDIVPVVIIVSITYRSPKWEAGRFAQTADVYLLMTGLGGHFISPSFAQWAQQKRSAFLKQLWGVARLT